jgi:UDP-glucose 4-epimerase
MRVGVTGASGFLGSMLVERLAARDDVHVVALTRTLSPDHGHQRPNVDWREGDLSSPHDAAGFVADLDSVVHLAHKGSPLTSGRDLADDARSNLVPTLTLLQAIRERGTPCHVVYASSGGALYGTSQPGERATELSPVVISSSYGIQKLAGENYLRLAAGEGWLTSVVLRIGNAYGAVLAPDRTQGFLGVAVSRLAAGEPLRLIGDTSNVRDYVHYSDVCSAFVRALEPRAPFDLFNIGTGHGTSIHDLVPMLEDVSGMRITLERAPDDVEARRLPRWVVLDSSKANAELGWEAMVPLRDGLQRLWRIAAG